MLLVACGGKTEAPQPILGASGRFGTAGATDSEAGESAHDHAGVAGSFAAAGATSSEAGEGGGGSAEAGAGGALDTWPSAGSAATATTEGELGSGCTMKIGHIAGANAPVNDPFVPAGAEPVAPEHLSHPPQVGLRGSIVVPDLGGYIYLDLIVGGALRAGKKYPIDPYGPEATTSVLFARGEPIRAGWAAVPGGFVTVTGVYRDPYLHRGEVTFRIDRLKLEANAAIPDNEATGSFEFTGSCTGTMPLPEP